MIDLSKLSLSLEVRNLSFCGVSVSFGPKAAVPVAGRLTATCSVSEANPEPVAVSCLEATRLGIGTHFRCVVVREAELMYVEVKAEMSEREGEIRLKTDNFQTIHFSEPLLHCNYTGRLSKSKIFATLVQRGLLGIMLVSYPV